LFLVIILLTVIHCFTFCSSY